MSNLNLNDILTDIANAIREKKGTVDPIYPVDFAEEISTISGGGGDQPQLHAPTISRTARTRTINVSNPSSNGSYVEACAIYVNDMKVTTSGSAQVNIAPYVQAHDYYRIYAKFEASNFIDSPASNVNIYDNTMLHAPTIEVHGRTLTILNPMSNEDFVTSYDVYMNGSFIANTTSTTFDFESYLTAYGTYSFKVKAKGTGYDDSDFSNEVSYEYSSISPILADNDWTSIRAVCQAGQAANYWNLGDTKTDVGKDGKTRTFRICDMQGLYNKHVVFEQLEDDYFNGKKINDERNHDDDDCYANYSKSYTRSTHLPTLQGYYSSELSSNLTDTTYKVGKNGKSTVIYELTNKLFLAAEREVSKIRKRCTAEEWDALVTFSLYANVLPANIEKFRRRNHGWNLRSAQEDNASVFVVVDSDGSIGGVYAYGAPQLSPCFAF